MGSLLILQLLNSLKNALLRNWKIIVFLLLIICAGGYWFYLHSEIVSDQQTIVSLNQTVKIKILENQQCTTNNNVLQQSIVSQNKQIQKLHAQYEADLQLQKQETLKLKQQQANDKQALTAIKTQPLPTTCKSSITYLIDNVKGLKKW
jgi:uncharacterized protein YxeA